MKMSEIGIRHEAVLINKLFYLQAQQKLLLIASKEQTRYFYTLKT